MKKTLSLILCFIFALIPVNIYGAEKMKDIRKRSYPSHLKELNLTASSPTSYEDAMNRIARMKPDGYVIASVNYAKMKGKFSVAVKLNKL